jgi:glycerol-1-phosphatase
VSGYHPDLLWKIVIDGAILVRRGLPWVASNTDLTVPTPHGRGPGNGVLVEAVARYAGREPVVAGKPQPPLFEETLRRCGGSHPLVVGDRLDTDILGGNNAGFATVAVLTGVDTRQTILAARAAERPDYIIGNLADLHRPYPEVTHDDDTYVCGEATARVANGAVGIIGSQDNLDSWRAACAAWWAATPDAPTPQAPKLVWLDH